MKKLLLLFFTLFLFTHLPAQMNGPKNGKSSGNGSLHGAEQAWMNTANAAGADHEYASFGDLSNVPGSHTDYLLSTGFGFDIPTGFQIKGIRVYVDNSDANNVTSDYSIRIMKNGVVGETERSTGALYSNTDTASQTYGGASDLWGESWSAADINANDFGVAIAAQRAVAGKPTQGRIDDIRIVVYYIDPASLPSFTLPLNLVSFTATPKNDMVRIEWKTTDESDMDRFEIQRSVNGTEFNSFGTLMCRNQLTTALYAFNDNVPFRGTSYYRLKILEKSGSVVYSNVVVIQFKTDNAAILYPNPWKKGQNLFIRNATNQKLAIEIYDNAGTLVSRISTASGEVPAETLNNAKGVLRYKVYDEKNKLTGSGSLAIY